MERLVKRPASALRNASRPSNRDGINSPETLAKPALQRNGLFAVWGPRYAEHGVATFPIASAGDRKRPAVRQWRSMGVRASEQLAMRFGEADSFAFCAGRRSRLTIVDVDSDSEELLADALARHGKTPIVVRSGGGHYQAWYRHAGEPRRIRPNPQEPIDILGDGLVVAPPSLGRRQPYEFLAGCLDDLDHLPTMRTAPANDDSRMQATVTAGERIGAGSRNDALFRHAMRQAHHCDTVEDLIDCAFTWADSRTDRHDGHAFTDAEIRATAASAWRLTKSGRNFIGTGRKLVTSIDDFDRIAALGPDAWFLNCFLRRNHWGRPFVIANALKDEMPGGAWSLVRLQEARRRLIQCGLIKSLRPASRQHGPELFQWA